MSVSKTDKKKRRDIQLIKDAEYVNKLCYINVSYYYVNKLLMFHITTEAATGGVLDLMS